MRTTVDIEKLLLAELRERARQTGVPLKKLLNSSLRRGLAEARSRSKSRSYRCPEHAMGQPVNAGLNLDKALQLADALEEQEVVHKLEAAMAIESGCELCSSDTDFQRFRRLKWFNPLRGQ